jgi:hypothetical protein
MANVLIAIVMPLQSGKRKPEYLVYKQGVTSIFHKPGPFKNPKHWILNSES